MLRFQVLWFNNLDYGILRVALDLQAREGMTKVGLIAIQCISLCIFSFCSDISV